MTHQEQQEQEQQEQQQEHYITINEMIDGIASQQQHKLTK